ncbi:filamentous hemagglutinin family protein [Brenneria populi subsp. brevivirga]|uniref:filamentous haemagglutinin family protein n=1 Tax=Brenneria populi TaxID=1505588 RepID=UPI002E199944|nr:filamentous hemagglutinin family protein [Brenneria populi subsp. brevivirga]
MPQSGDADRDRYLWKEVIMPSRHSERFRNNVAGPRRVFRLSPLACSLSLLLMAGAAQAAERPFSGAWFAQAGAARSTAAQGSASSGAGSSLSSATTSALKQQQDASRQLQRSVNNLTRSASLIASQQSIQAAARTAARQADSAIPDGLATGGLKVDTNAATQGWTNANAPTQTVAGGKTTVTIEQTADKAILNWETFNVGRNTTVSFEQDSNWAVLNRVNDPNARPSEIQGQINADGTVMIVNRNGVVFSGSSQVNVRNLAAAAANISDAQFKNGLYNGSGATFTGAGGAVKVEQGALIATHAPESSTDGGGYVLLLGKEANNAGEIVTAGGQSVLAAGDDFIIKKGYGTDGNQTSTTRGNEVTASGGGTALNSGLIRAATGDVTLTGGEVRQESVVASTTSQDARGTVHLTATGAVTLGADSATAILLEETDASALDSQRDGLLAPAVDTSSDDQNIVAADKYRRDLSLVEIKGDTVDFAGDSLTLATGGQIAVDAASRALLRDGAVLDVSGALGVKVAMETNSVLVSIQGNELRDASVNRDSAGNTEDGGSLLNSSDVWVDARDLIYVPAGTNGYESDRWYTAGGLLEVSGYLGTTGHGVGEWMAQGGTVSFTGNEVVTQAGSQINLSGGTLDVQSGEIRLSWFKGSDGRLYEVSSAPADVLYTGIYRGYEVNHERWGVTETYYNPLIAPTSRRENGYTVGRDAGTLTIGTRSAVLEGDIAGDTYQGERQTQAAQAGLDGYSQSQKAVARGAQLVVGSYTPYYLKDSGTLQYGLTATDSTARTVVLSVEVAAIAADLALDGELPEERRGTLYLDTGLLNETGLGALRIAAREGITVDDALTVGDGGEITLYGPRVEVNADLVAHGGAIALGNVLNQVNSNRRVEDTPLAAPAGATAAVTVAEGVALDAGGLWSNLRLDAANIAALPYKDGGSVAIRSTGDVTLGAGSLIDVSSGAALAADGSFSGGAGGSVTLHASANQSGGVGTLTLNGELRGYGVDGGGTLDLRAKSVTIGGDEEESAADLWLDETFFNKGFSQYRLTGLQGASVAAGATVDVVMPVYRQGQGTLGAMTGTPASAALELWTPPLYQEDPAAGALTQRQGASLALLAGTAQSDAADVAQVQALIGKGATVTVDPGRSIAVRSIGQLTVEGALNAWGGSIELGAIATSTESASGRSIWIGEEAVLDVAGRATVATDALGRRYGIVDAGGEIVIGGAFDAVTGTAGAEDAITGSADADDLFVVVRKGALLDASGASAVLDIAGQGATAVAGSGGGITLASSNGLYIDGTLRAQSGGAGAAGGSLTLVLDTPLYANSADERVRRARELVLSQTQTESPLADGIGTGEAADLLVYGHGAIGADQIEAGGFDNLTLASDGLLSFDGDLSLTLGQSLNLYARVLGLTDAASADTRVSLAAPYVRLAGMGGAVGGDNRIHPTVHGGGSAAVSRQDLTGILLIQADRLLEVRDQINVGVYAAAGSTTEKLVEAVDRRGFDDVQLVSGGDLRFSGSQLYVPGDLTLAAAQIYPTTGANATVYAGWQGNNADFDLERVLTLARTTDEVPEVPYSVFGRLTLDAAAIDQGGVLRAPLGALNLGASSSATRSTRTVSLLDGSLTSVSAAGLTMPYGGTADGVVWEYAGEEIALNGVGSTTAGSVTLSGQYVDVREGATIDLSGGGELTGAGFVSGRGGSTDARYSPLAQLSSDGLVLPGLDSNPVYALVPGVQALAAPAGGEAGAVDPLLGRQVTIGAGVPGLPVGTYTLLPSTYALLPGAFRVEINGLAGQGAATAAAQMRNGSYSTSGVLSIAGTDIRDSLARQLILTSADVLRSYSQYNETSYAAFAAADAATRGIPRAQIEADAKLLQLRFTTRDKENEELSLQFAGTVLGEAAEGGYGSTLAVLGNGLGIEILGDAAAPSAVFAIALRASDLSRINVNRLAIGALPTVTYGQGGNLVRMDQTVGGAATSIVLRDGAELAAPEVMLITIADSIEIEQGAVINTLGQGAVAYDSNDGFIYQPGNLSVVSVSNGVQQWLAPSRSSTAGPGPIRVGTCAAGDCTGTTQLYSEGTIAFVTDNDFQLDDAVRYGTRHLSLAVGAFNIGGQQALADAEARGALTSGLVLNQQVMERLLQGDTSTGAPALETLELIAGESVNFFDSVTLSTLDADGNSLLDELLLTTPAIYGYGDADDVALIQTGHLVWNGSANAPGAVATDGAGTGSGVFQVEAERISFGYGSYGRPDGVSSLDRLALGFAAVNLSASERVTANNAGTLAVYQTQGEYVAGQGYRYSGGDLNIVTPLLTGEDGAVNAVTAGGAIAVSAPAAGAADAATVTIADLGAEWSLTAGDGLSLDTTVALPSGRLTLAAQGDVALGDLAYLDLSGRGIEFFDDEEATQYSWGGDVILTSTAGDITQAAGSTIDLSAEYNQAGSLSAAALGETAGAVELRGAILGSASGYYDAGGTDVPYQAGRVTVRAQSLGGELNAAFAALNQRLNAGEVYGLRSFQLKQGDLTIGDGLKANQIEVSLDGGHLTVAGTVDAAGERVGNIRLAGGQGLTLTGDALLDAHGNLLRLDSYGEVIDAANRASVELNSGTGTLTLADGARIDLRHGTDDTRIEADPSLADDVARGTLTLYAPRLGADAAGDVAIDAGGSYAIEGAKSIVLHAVRRYDDAPAGGDEAAGGESYQIIDQDYLDEKHADSTAFITAALENGDLLNTKLAGLNNATYRQVFHLRPGIEIVTEGDLVLNGDLDLSGYRYASLNTTNPVYRNYREDAQPGDADYGFGEPGALVVRAGGDLSIYGSVTDGFAPPPETPDDDGWVLTPGVQGYGGDVVVPRAGVTLAEGTRFPAGKVLNYDLPLQATTLAADTVLPAQAKLAASLTLPAGAVLSATVTLPDGTVYAAGSVLKNAVTLGEGTTLDAGFRLSAATSLKAMTWPKGVALPDTSGGATLLLADGLTLPLGALIPSMTDVVLPDGALSVNLRPEGVTTRNWAVAAMLPEGSLSWSLRLVAGSDAEAADARLTRADGKGDMILADTHYSLYTQYEIIPGTPEQPGWVWYWTEEGATLYKQTADTPAGRRYTSVCSRNEGVYCVKVSYVWTEAGVKQYDRFGSNGYEVGKPVPEARVTSACVTNAARGFCSRTAEPIPGTPDTVGDPVKVYPVAQNFSVLRTGTSDLDLIAGGDVAMQSLYGVYTAGTSTASQAGDQAANFNQTRAKAADNTYLNTSNTAAVPDGEDKAGPLYEALVNGGDSSTYAAWYPDGGGNLLVIAGGDFSGDMLATYNTSSPSDDLRAQRSSADVGNWLWRQGSGDTAGMDAIPASWWINFGTYVSGKTELNYSYDLSGNERASAGAVPELVGFTGVGTLGGGNLTLQVAGDAGLLTRRGSATSSTNQPRSQGLALTVASTGRVLSDGSILLTGGGDMMVSIGGDLNPGLTARAVPNPNTTVSSAADYRRENLDLNGVLTNLRGDLTLQAGAAGGMALVYYQTGSSQVDDRETRAYDPYGSSLATATGGPVLMLGDAVATLNMRGDLVLSGSGDPGRVALPTSMPYTQNGGVLQSGGYGWFSLWTENTAINLFSAGGDLTPSVQLGDVSGNASAVSPNKGRNTSPTDGRFVWPSQLSAAAPGGSLYLGTSALGSGAGTTDYNAAYSLLLAPSDNASLALLAGDSIYAGGYVVSVSAASTDALPTPFDPAFAVLTGSTGALTLHNLSADAIRPDTNRFPLFAFGPDTATEEDDGNATPVRLYALTGDIVGLGSGQILAFKNGQRAGQTWYEGAGPVWLRAGRDIVRSGTLLDESVSIPTEMASTPSSFTTSSGGISTGNLFVHGSATDVSIVEAGRDILYSGFNVVGPGTLEVSAGGNILLAGQVEGGWYGEAAVTSLGPIVAGDNRPGAGIVVQAGLGETGADWNGFLSLYLDPANQADVTSGLPLADQEGKVAKTYQEELIAWLAERYGFAPAGDESAVGDALAYFNALPDEQRRIFARRVYFAELRAGGREYNDADGPRFGSYLRGREAIAALFPEQDADGNAIAYGGNVLAYGGAGVHTDVGGDIQVLTPGGTQTFGVAGEAPPSTAGVITQGQGDIQLYSLGSILLGQSRIMTTFGGGILAWSAQGDINAGRGSKTTIVYTPPRRVYDQWGNVALSPTVPSTGAGIATLNPIPEVPAGDVDLVAPLGTIDAGEAGIRVSGNVNIAALRVVNAQNIQVQGESTGLPAAVTVNVGALTSASQSASSAVQAAEQINRQSQGGRPSIVSVEILGYGNERLQPGGEALPDGARNAPQDYRPDSAIQVLGAGPLSSASAALLTPEEKSGLF